MNGGLILIKEFLPQVKPSEKNAAAYMLEHPEEVIRLSIQDLAKKSGSSESAIIRLCKALGVSGFRELKLKIAGDIQLADSRPTAYSEIKPGDDVSHIIGALSGSHISSIQQTLYANEANLLKQAVTAISKARKLDLYGVGASQLVAQDAEQKFARIGKWCTAYADNHLQLTSAANLKKGDAAIVISYSGETDQLIPVLQQAKAAGAVVITLTKKGVNALSELADIPLYTVSEEAAIRSAATSSRIVQLFVMDAIYTAVAGMHYDETVEALEKSRTAIFKAFQT